MSRRPDHLGKRKDFSGVRLMDLPCANPHCDRNGKIRAGSDVVCNKHYQRWINGKDHMAADPVRIKHKCCTVDDCDKPVRSGYSKYCEMHYGRLRRGASLVSDTDAITNCLYCDTPLPEGKYKFCSKRCMHRHKRGAPLKINCMMCGVEIYPLDRFQVCSDHCARERSRLRGRETYDRNLDRLGVQMKNRNREYIRRAKKHGVEWVMFDTIAEVFDRDEWVCQICGEDTNLDASWPDKDFPSLDHIVPMSAGGTHTPSNCQTSHLHCNLSKAHKSDKAMAAKVKRMSGEKGQFARRKKNGSQIQSRGFDKRFKRKMNGEVVKA